MLTRIISLFGLMDGLKGKCQCLSICLVDLGLGGIHFRLLVFLAFVLLEIKSLASNSNQCVANTKWGIVVVVTKESHCLTTRI